MNQPTEPSETVTPWELISSTTALDEKWFPVRKDVVKLPSGRVMDDYFVWESPNIALVVPVTKDGLFVLCEQYRHAIGKVLCQFPAGAIGKNEDPKQAAIREMTEETGYTGGSITHLQTISPYPTKLTGLHYLYLAQGVELSSSPPEDDAEETKVVLKTREELEEILYGSDVQVADSLTAALLALKTLDS